MPDMVMENFDAKDPGCVAPKGAAPKGAAFVLAGGKSKRMPFDKQTIRIDGNLIAVHTADTLSAMFSDVFIVSNAKSLYAECRYKVIPDEIDGCGPLGGLYTALCNTPGEYAYVTGCDMPFINLKYIGYLKEQLDKAEKSMDGILTTTNGLVEPLNAFYHKRLRHLIPPILSGGRRRMVELYEGKDLIYVPESVLKKFDPEYMMFFNLNTMEDYRRYVSQLADGRGAH